MPSLAPSAALRLPPLDPGEFRYITKTINVEPPDDQGRRRFKMVMSSTIRDMRGDEIKPVALEKMAAQFREGRTIFLNHGRIVPEDAFGTSDEAEIRQAGVTDEKGLPVWDLHVAGIVNQPNPRAANLADSMEGGFVKFGASIGAMVNKKGVKPNDHGGLDIWDLEIKEGSIVGIPMQQRAWVYKAADAAAALDEEEDEDEEESVAETTETAEAAADTEAEADKALDTADGAALQRQDLIEKKPEDEDTETADDAASTTVEEVTSGVQESATETPETTPGETEDESDPAIEQKLLSVEPGDLSELIKRASDLATLADQQRDQIVTLKAERDEARRERDEAKGQLEPAREVIKQVMSLPLRPKTAGYIEQFTERFPQFDPEIAQYLTKRGAMNE